jgi:hypothetical protein
VTQRRQSEDNGDDEQSSDDETNPRIDPGPAHEGDERVDNSSGETTGTAQAAKNRQADPPA